MPPALDSSSTPLSRVSDVHARRLEVFVEIPPSPFHSSRMAPLNAQQATSKSAPAPAMPPQLTTLNVTPNTLKRKLDVFVEIPPSPLHRTTPKSYFVPRRKSQVYVSIPPSPLGVSRMKGTLNNGIGPSPLSTKAFNVNKPADSSNKKRKLSDISKPQWKGGQFSENEPYPNGAFNCHQCRKKYDNSFGVNCTILLNKRCRNMYCKTCLRNRYGLDAEKLKLRAPLSNGSHVSGVPYHWTCPKCADTCNCKYCRKKKGLLALGKIPMPQSPTNLLTPVHPGRMGVFKVAGPFVDSVSSKESKLYLHEQSKPRAPRVKKPISEPKWTSVPIEFTRTQVEDRLFLREFILRFSPLMKIGVTYLEELDLFDNLSARCARALISCLLDLIAADADPEETKLIRETLKKISVAGASPSTLWARLKLLRNHLPSGFFVAPIPDPSPRPSYAESEPEDEDEPEPAPPRSSQRIKTMRGKSNTPVEEEEVLDLNNGVTHALQLLPCIIALCECALQRPSIHAEIETGVKGAREENRGYFADVRKENERWAKERASLGWGEGKDEEEEQGEPNKGKGKEKDSEKNKAYRSALAEHKTKLAALENVHSLELQGATPRFSPLGWDSHGRVYYASSALRRKVKRAKASIPEEEDRTGLQKWGWFLAVWGRGSMKAGTSSSGDKEECWWGFADHAEVRQLGKWLAAAEGVDGKGSIVEGPGVIIVKGGEGVKKPEGSSGSDVRFALGKGPPSQAQVKALVKSLHEYADLLEWRINGGEAQN